MRQFLLSSTKFSGTVMITFDDEGSLSVCDFSAAEISQEQRDQILQVLPIHVDRVQTMVAGSKTAKLQEVKADPTFDDFWNRYDEKVRSSKKKAARIWDRLSKVDRIRAYSFISKYESSILPGTAKKYAETYLNAELWNN